MIVKVLVRFWEQVLRVKYGFSMKSYKLVRDTCEIQLFLDIQLELHSKEFQIGKNCEVLWRPER